jgi:mitogen-activated protein kinase kinase
MSGFETRTMARKNRKGLALPSMPSKTPEPSAGDAQIPGAIGNNNGSMDTLEIGVEFQLDLKTDEFVFLKELGAGNGGTVSKVMHPATKIIMARKVWTIMTQHHLLANLEHRSYTLKQKRRFGRILCGSCIS